MKKRIVAPLVLLSLPLFVNASIDLDKKTSRTLVQQQENKQFHDDEEVRVIVTLEHEPVLRVKLAKSNPQIKSLARTKSLSSVQQSIKSEQKRLFERLKSNNVKFDVLRQSHYSNNQVVLTTKHKNLSSIRNLPSVKRVTIDREVKALVTEGAVQIGADKVWQLQDQQNRTVTGKDVRVAILDTGVDYTHPDLGGCFGSSCKVVGGYDFVNNDADPIDDQGHGTHVAGITAANGEIKGVAPDATLYAVKVLDENGRGYTSDVIAGIEWALNPDGDATTDDQVDVVNMSLGSLGNPLDEEREVFALAEAAGTLMVVAAGNDGGNGALLRGPISAMAKIESSLAVGAVDDNNEIAIFSSWGPGDDVVKPDVMAPGVEINSTQIGGGYIQHSGTSMATPHVAGAAALLKQLNPTHSASEIKANLINQAQDISLEVYKQGAGVIDVYQSAISELSSSVGRLEYGWVNSEQQIWQKEVSFTLYNNTDTSQNLNLAVANELPEGSMIELSATDHTLEANSNVEIKATLTVDTAVTQPKESSFMAYESAINVSGDNELSIPLTFFYAPAFSVATTELTEEDNWSYSVVIMKDSTFFHSEVAFGSGNKVQSYHLPADTYDIAVGWYTDKTNRVSIRIYDSVTISASKGFQIKYDDDEVIGKLNLDFTDVNGDVFRDKVISDDVIYEGSLYVRYKNTDTTITSLNLLSFFGQDYSINLDMDKYDVQGYVNYMKRDHSENSFIPFVVNGELAEEISLTNDHSKYIPLNFEYGLKPEMDDFRMLYGKAADTFLEGTALTFQDAITSSTEYTMPYPEGYNLYRGQYRETWNSRSFSDREMMVQSPTYRVVDDKIEFFNPVTNEYYRTELLEEMNTMSVGRLVPYFGGKLIREEFYGQSEVALTYSRATNSALFSDSSLSAWDGTSYMQCGNCFFGSEDVPNKFSYVDMGDYSILGSTGASSLVFDFTAAYLDQKPVTAKAELAFNADNTDFSPPYLTGIDTLNADKLSPNLPALETGKVKLEVRDDVEISSVVAQLKLENTEEWIDAEVTEQNGDYVIALQGLEAGYYGIKLIATDSSDNSLTYTVSPAFSIGNCEQDQDCDTVPDDIDAFPQDPTESVDTDGDGIGNNADPDDDNDGVNDEEDAFPLDATESVDTDSDGIGNNADTDDDGDGVQDSADAFPLDATESVDTDSDGIGNNADTDDDGDGVLDINDAFPLDAAESVDTDGDGIGNNADTDDDGDGVLDIGDAFPLDASKSELPSRSGGSMSALWLLSLLALRLRFNARREMKSA